MDFANKRSGNNLNYMKITKIMTKVSKLKLLITNEFW